MLDDAIFFLPVRELAARLRAKTLTSAALTEGCLDRLERIGPKYNAIVTVMRDSALAEAKRADAALKGGKPQSLLCGIPYGVKDLVATKGVPTTWGATPYKDQVCDYDATVVERLRAAGAVLWAKLSMVKLAGRMV
jgi:aspartyl-tRNA(Asn)/glutamyl-tRNA(Gln) amidotransferase subunit A